MTIRFLCALLAISLGLNASISPAELEAHVSFLASDALEGRDTPSKGLDIAAEYIASQMRRAGLKPAGPEGFFQTARFLSLQVNKEGLALSATADGKTLTVEPGKLRLGLGPATDLMEADSFHAKLGDDSVPWGERSESVLILDVPANLTPQILRQSLTRLKDSKWTGKAVILLGSVFLSTSAMGASTTIGADPSFLVLSVSDEAFVQWGRSLPVGKVEGKLNLKAAAPLSREIVARNVVGLLEGSDEKLKDSYILLTAHYDHLGVRDGDPDRVFNGANDNASGVASVLESAWWLHEAKPKRSVLFITFFGEEKGLLGARYYTEHPVRPLANTVANVNLEQMGRTDSSEGPNVKMANLTGYNFTNIHKFFEQAGEKTTLKIVKHERFSDPFYAASDNAALAQVGIPATTVSVTYQFSDYHQRGDEWQKLDYKNMALVTETVAEAVKNMADSAEAVAWNSDEAKTKNYVEAARKLKAIQP